MLPRDLNNLRKWLYKTHSKLIKTFPFGRQKHTQSWITEKIFSRQGKPIRRLNESGMCKGLSYVSMLYVLSSPRDKNGQLKNLTKLKNILTRLVAMELPEFKLRQQILNKKIELMLQTVHHKIDQLDDEAIRTELLRMQNENLIDASLYDATTTPEKARNIYFQKLCDEYRNRHFSTNEKLEESF